MFRKKKLRMEKIDFDTDINTSYLGEVLFENVKNKNNILCLYIGQWIWGGIFIEGELFYSLIHLEKTHIKLLRKKKINTSNIVLIIEFVWKDLPMKLL